MASGHTSNLFEPWGTLRSAPLCTVASAVLAWVALSGCKNEVRCPEPRVIIVNVPVAVSPPSSAPTGNTTSASESHPTSPEEATEQLLAELNAPGDMEPLRCLSALGSPRIDCDVSIDPRWLQFVNRMQAGVRLVSGMQQNAGTVRNLRLDIRIGIDGHADGHAVGSFHRDEYLALHRALVAQVGQLCSWDDNDLNMSLSCLRAMGAANSISPYLVGVRRDLAAIDPQTYHAQWNPFVVRTFTHVERGPEYRGVLIRAHLAFYVSRLRAGEVGALLGSASWNVSSVDGGVRL